MDGGRGCCGDAPHPGPPPQEGGGGDALTFCCMRGWAGFNKDWILKDKDNHRPSPTKNSFDNSNLAAFGFHGKATALAAEELQKRYDLADVGAI